MNRLLQILSIIFLTSCGLETNKQEIKKSFSIPVISQEASKDTFELFKKDFITHSWTLFEGKNEFVDSLKIPIKPDRNYTIYEEFLYKNYLSALDSFGLDGFEIYPDYPTTVSRIEYGYLEGNYFYPVYIVNQTPNKKLFIGKNSFVFAIQEALDEKGEWRPIEGRGFDFCGNGYWGLIVNTNEFLTVLFPKYDGDYKTKIRVRIQNNDIVYVSKPFEGIINRNQFILDKERDYFYRELVENKASAIQHLFYGSEPLEFKDENFGLHVVWTR